MVNERICDEKIQQARITRAALFLLLLGMGHKTDGKKLEISIDMKKILAAVRDIGADSVVAMFNTLIDQNYSSRMIKGNLPRPAETLMQKLYKKYKIVLRLRGLRGN